MNLDNSKTKAPRVTVTLIALSAITPLAILLSIDLLDKPDFDLITWLGVVAMLFVIVCAWRVTLSRSQSADETIEDSTLLTAGASKSFGVRTRDEFGELLE